MAKLYNLAAMTVASTGAGTITLGSAAIILGVLYLSFTAAGASDGETIAYSIGDVGASEDGTGVLGGGGTTLTRIPVRSTNGNAAINMTAAAIVRISPAKEDLANLRENNTFTGTQTINPTAGTLSKGFVVNQTLPPTGTFSGPIFGNVLTIINPGVTANDSGIDAFGQINAQVTGFRINYTSGGGGLNNIAFNAANWVTGQTDAVGDIAGVATATNVSTHNLWGRIGYGILLPGGASRNLISLEGEVGIATGASAEYMAALSANSQGPVLGSTLTAALMVSTIDQLPGAAAPFPHLIALSKNLYSGGRFPIAATGDLIFSDATGTIANGINLPNVTFTATVLNTPLASIGGNGTAIFGADASHLPGSGVNVTAPFSGVVQIQGLPNTGNNGDGVTVLDSAGTNIAFFGVQEASTTAVRFGQVAANFGQFVTLGSTSAGAMFGTVTSDPAIIGTNNTARMTFAAGGNIGAGTETNPQAPFVISSNVTTGIAALTNTALALNGADNTSPNMLINSYGAGTNPALIMQGANGTAAVPSASKADNFLAFFAGRGYAASAYDVAPLSGFFIAAGEDHALGANGTYLGFFNVANGGTLRTEKARLGLGLSVGTTIEAGAGNALINGTYKTNTAPTAVAGAGPILTGSASTLNKRMMVNLNGVDYWIPCSATAF